MVEFSKPTLLLITQGQKHLSADGLSLFVLHSLSDSICFRHSNSYSLGLIFTVIQGVRFVFGGLSPLMPPTPATLLKTRTYVSTEI